MAKEGDIEIAVWANDRRESDRHPHVKAGKPVDVPCECGRVNQKWVSGWFSTGGPDDPDSAKLDGRIEKFLETLADKAGTYPVLKITLSPAEARSGSNSGPRPKPTETPEFEDDIPF